MSRTLNRFGIAPALVDKLSVAGIVKVSDYYESSATTLMTRAQLNRDELEAINRLIASKLAPASSNALQVLLGICETAAAEAANTAHASIVLTGSSSSGSGSAGIIGGVVAAGGGATQSPHHARTGSGGLDALLGGGLPRAGVTEVVGPPGMGKTQLCLSCCAAMALRGRGVVFIDTELKFDPLRLAGLVRSQMLSANTTSPSPSPSPNSSSGRGRGAATDGEAATGGAGVDRVLERVQVHRPATVAELMALLTGLESSLIGLGAGLVVVDSMAALLRQEGLSDADRDRLAAHWAALLKRAADLCRCCVLVTNQVTSLGSSAEDKQAAALCRDAIGDAAGLLFRPALGVAWSHCVDTRLVLQSSPVPMSGSGSGLGLRSMASGSGSGVRVVCVDKSATRARVRAEYSITADGISVGPAVCLTGD